MTVKPGASAQTENTETQTGSESGEVKETKAGTQTAGQEGDGQSGEEDAIYSDPTKVKDLVKSLRTENAKHRTKNKELDSKLSGLEATLGKLKSALGGEEEETDPAVAAQNLAAQNQALHVELGIAQLALEHGIGSSDAQFFKFLLAQKFEGLGEGEEVTDDDVKAIVSEVKKRGGAASNGSTGLNLESRPNADKKTDLSVEEFAGLGLAEKSQLYAKNPDQYQKLFNEAVKKRLI